jgi:hypothetical protein
VKKTAAFYRKKPSTTIPDPRMRRPAAGGYSREQTVSLAEVPLCCLQFVS